MGSAKDTDKEGHFSWRGSASTQWSLHVLWISHPCPHRGVCLCSRKLFLSASRSLPLRAHFSLLCKAAQGGQHLSCWGNLYPLHDAETQIPCLLCQISAMGKTPPQYPPSWPRPDSQSGMPSVPTQTHNQLGTPVIKPISS